MTMHDFKEHDFVADFKTDGQRTYRRPAKEYRRNLCAAVVAGIRLYEYGRLIADNFKSLALILGESCACAGIQKGNTDLIIG